MFFGTTPACITSFLARELAHFRPRRVIEPCAGNFVISQAAGATLGDTVQVISGDVSVYSNSIGYGIADIDVGIRLREAMADEYPVFAGIERPSRIAAMVIIWAELATYLGKNGIRYYETLVEDILANAGQYLDRYEAKILAIREMVPNFTYQAQCATVTMADVQKDDLVWFDPPHIAGDYEKMFATLCDCLTYDDVPYVEFDEDGRNRMLTDAIERGAWVVTRPDHQIDVDGLDLVYRFEYKAEKHYYLYSNRCSSVAQGRAITLREEDPGFDAIGPGDQLGFRDTARLVKMDMKHANHYRLLWTKKAKMKNMGMPYGVWIGSRLIGILQLCDGAIFNHHTIIIVADCASLGSDYVRLGKLLLMLCLTDETLAMFNSDSMWHHDQFSTVAYTNSPSSMKYRPFFDLTERKEPAPSGHKYALSYHSKPIKHKTLKSAYRAWHQKHSKEVRDGE